MPSSVLLVSYNALSPDREDEFNIWNNHFFLQQVLRTPGISAATRYKLSHTQMEWMIPMSSVPEWPYGKDPYLTIFEVDGAAATVFQALRNAEPSRASRDPANDPVAWGAQLLYEPITAVESSAWLKPTEAPPAPSTAPRAVWVVYSTPHPGKEAENDSWYLAQGNLRGPGFDSMLRYQLSKTQGVVDSRAPTPAGAWPHGLDTNLAIWQLSDPELAVASRRRSQGQAVPGPRFSWMPPISDLRRGGEHLIYEPVSNRVTPIWIKRET